MPSDPNPDKRFATTLARGLGVLRAFRVSDDGLSNAEISDRTGLPKSTVSRLTFTLQKLGYLNHARRHDRYRPGPALLALGNVAAASIPFVDLSDGLMQGVADATGTLGLLLVRDGARMLIVKTWRPRAVASIWLDVGHRLPMIDSSSGHALLAALSQDQLRDSLDMQDPRAPSLESAGAARAEAQAQLRETGFVIADPDSYFAEGIHAVAVPFQSADLFEPVVFTCGGLPDILPMERMQRDVGPQLRAAIQELSKRVGQVVPPGTDPTGARAG